MDLLKSLKRLDTLKEAEMYREWRSTCFDWLRGQPRACSMAAAWGIAALWFFCFGCWKDYLQSPTKAQRLDTLRRICTPTDLKLLSHTCLLNRKKDTVHATDGCNNRPGLALGDHKYHFKQQILPHKSNTGWPPRDTPCPYNQIDSRYHMVIFSKVYGTPAVILIQSPSLKEELNFTS